MRRGIAIGALLLAGVSPVLLQCQDEPRYGDEVARKGSLTLPLEAVGRSGNRYRLRDGVFIVERRVNAGASQGGSDASSATATFGGITTSGSGTGGSVATGGGRSAVGGIGGATGGTGVTGSRGATTRGGGATGDSGPVGFGGGSGATGASGATAGSGGATGDSGSVGFGGGSGATGGSSEGSGASFSSVVTTGGSVVTTVSTGVGGSAGGEFEFERILFSEDALQEPELVARLRSGEYRIVLEPGWIMERITPEGDSDFVQAQLTSSALQFFEIFPRDVSFVFYSFLVDGDEVIFGRDGDLIVGIDVEEVQQQGFDRRSLIETSEIAMAQLSLEETLDAIGRNAGLDANGETLYQQIIDSYASAPGRMDSAVHCGDTSQGGEPTLNGYPIRCDRLEATQFDNLGSWFATAAVNRIDLAPENGAHCGQQRLIFANNEPIGNGRVFMIVEAQVPNSAPDLGLEGCLPLAQFWRSLEGVDDPTLRGELLRAAFLDGGLAGSAPFMTAPNLTAGTGQIRTNNFNDFFWTLREFKLVAGDNEASAVPFPVAEAAHGPLWNDTQSFPFGEQCRQNFLQALDGLLVDDPAQMAFIIDHECKDAESPNDFFTQDYALHLSQGDPGGFFSALEQRLQGTQLSPFDVAARARFAGSCIGCHEEAIGSPLGRGVQAPFSNGFVHVSEDFREDCGDGTPCFAISQALREVFLPHRAAVLGELLGDGGSGGANGAGGANGVDGVGGGFGEAVSSVGGTQFGSATSGGDAASTGSIGAGGAPGNVASADLSLEELVEEDEEAKADWGRRTLGGQPARVTH